MAKLSFFPLAYCYFFLLDLFSYVYNRYDRVHPQQVYEILLEADESIKP